MADLRSRVSGRSDGRAQVYHAGSVARDRRWPGSEKSGLRDNSRRVTAAGRHRGGLILPGVTMLCRSLQVNTAGIGLQDDAPASGILALGTRAGVEHGRSGVWGAAGSSRAFER